MTGVVPVRADHLEPGTTSHLMGTGKPRWSRSGITIAPPDGYRATYGYTEDLRAFVEIADQGSFTRAAAHLVISQPTLSRVLKLVG